MTIKKLKRMFNRAGRIELNNWSTTDWVFDNKAKTLRVATSEFDHVVTYDAIKNARIDEGYVVCITDAEDQTSEISLEFFHPERRMKP